MTNPSVKRFQRLLRKLIKLKDIQVFQVIRVNTVQGCDGQRKCNPKLEALLKQQYDSVFRSELPDGLALERTVDHEIETEDGGKSPHRRLF